MHVEPLDTGINSINRIDPCRKFVTRLIGTGISV